MNERGGPRRPPIAARVCAVAVVATIAAGASSCEPIEPRPLVSAPLNRCPCEGYAPGTTTAARCSSRNRCEILTAGGRPELPFWIVVHVPTSSVFAPGLTFVLYSDAQGNPAFKEPLTAPGVVTRCRPPLCLPLGSLVGASGSYKVSSDASVLVGYPLFPGASIPVRVVYEPVGNEHDAQFPALPVDRLFASSRLGRSGAAEFVRAIPSGRYRRVFYPEPPFDAFFPPRVDEIPPTTTDFLVDTITLGGDVPLDDVASRTAVVSRADGLDGWRVWLVDRPSQRRISVIRTLAGAEAQVPLYTSGAQPAFQRDDVDAVVAPPPSWTAVPRYVTPLFSGAGLNLSYPSVPPPVTVSGVVAEPGARGGVLFGYSAKVTLESDEITTLGAPSQLLSYATTVNTDDRGRFATVLPPGTYVATVEPAVGTGYAKHRELVMVDRAHASLRFQPPPRTLVKGRAVLTDGRALSEAEVVAIPDRSASRRADRLAPAPRPGRARTDEDGRFAFELDPGGYVLSVLPKAGTGFPRVVVRPIVPSSPAGQETELPEIRVPAPIRLAFTLRDPTPTGNVIANALVRVFARPAGDEASAELVDPVEIGSAMTGPDGSVELLIAQEPR